MSSTEQDHLAAVSDRLAALFPGTPADTIDAAVAAEHARFDGRSIRDFVPLLFERNTRAALDRSTDT